MELDFSSDVLEKLMYKRALADKKWLNILTQVFDERWFKVPNLGTTLKLVLKYYQKYDQVPNNHVIIALIKKYIEKRADSTIRVADVQEFLNDMATFEMNIPDEVVKTNLKEFIMRNAFYNSLYDNIDLLERGPEQYHKVVDKCLENFERVQKITFNDSDLGFDYFNAADMDQHWEYLSNPEAKIHSGWESIDAYTNGGFLKDGKMLALIMAQAGLGKSVFMSNLAVNFLKQNLSVVVISLEMSQDVYGTRFDAHISNSNINQLKQNKETTVSRIKEFYKKYPQSNLIIKEYPPRSIRTADIETYIENLKNAGKKVDVLIVDYLNLVLPNHKSDSMYKDGLAVSEELRALSYKFGCPVISATQSNSEGMNSKDIDMQNISESRGIAHTADFLAALYALDEDRENGIINMKLIKNRLGGRVGKVSHFKMDPDSLVVNDITFNEAVDVQSSDSELGNLMRSLPAISSDITSIE